MNQSQEQMIGSTMTLEGFNLTTSCCTVSHVVYLLLMGVRYVWLPLVSLLRCSCLYHFLCSHVV
jgi:hypothetical protein